ncbi:MAG: hypothetical protein IJY81_04655 [Lachnospiraceae bacterium]|nr:hypothetical protein [Lachnospiraceae bacterium]
MKRTEYIVNLLGTDKQIGIIVTDEDEIPLNLKRIARGEFATNANFSSRYANDSSNFSFISANLANDF